MAKKKKTEQEEKKLDTIAYSGNVTCTLKKGKKTIRKIKTKNQGTLNLFKGIVYALAGSTSSSLLPNYIGVGASDEPNSESTLTKTTLYDETARAKITSSVINSYKSAAGDDYLETGYYVIFSTTIPGSSFKANTAIREIGLFGDELNSLLARIVIQLDDGEGDLIIPLGTSITIE